LLKEMKTLGSHGDAGWEGRYQGREVRERGDAGERGKSEEEERQQGKGETLGEEGDTGGQGKQ